ncbi:hypothetical protein AJ80_00405 [Polytolypa hystricis UAMH7299]|uniref:3'-5' exonuclease domain-containing protein n=1 Tax=Polytolypa hystricis (strain UAMH7299) TaxID=1447883 RepID=A0A2B7Z2L5_POLH7|nr:hypothetical protein AJ80_00405 [Polytolypa hystricis UAMH7299]
MHFISDYAVSAPPSVWAEAMLVAQQGRPPSPSLLLLDSHYFSPNPTSASIRRCPRTRYLRRWPKSARRSFSSTRAAAAAPKPPPLKPLKASPLHVRAKPKPVLGKPTGLAAPKLSPPPLPKSTPSRVIRIPTAAVGRNAVLRKKTLPMDLDVLMQKSFGPIVKSRPPTAQAIKSLTERVNVHLASMHELALLSQRKVEEADESVRKKAKEIDEDVAALSLDFNIEPQMTPTSTKETSEIQAALEISKPGKVEKLVEKRVPKLVPTPMVAPVRKPPKPKLVDTPLLQEIRRLDNHLFNLRYELLGPLLDLYQILYERLVPYRDVCYELEQRRETMRWLVTSLPDIEKLASERRKLSEILKEPFIQVTTGYSLILQDLPLLRRIYAGHPNEYLFDRDHWDLLLVDIRISGHKWRQKVRELLYTHWRHYAHPEAWEFESSKAEARRISEEFSQSLMSLSRHLDDFREQGLESTARLPGFTSLIRHTRECRGITQTIVLRRFYLTKPKSSVYWKQLDVIEPFTKAMAGMLQLVHAVDMYRRSLHAIVKRSKAETTTMESLRGWYINFRENYHAEFNEAYDVFIEINWVRLQMDELLGHSGSTSGQQISSSDCERLERWIHVMNQDGDYPFAARQERFARRTRRVAKATNQTSVERPSNTEIKYSARRTNGTTKSPSQLPAPHVPRMRSGSDTHTKGAVEAPNQKASRRPRRKKKISNPLVGQSSRGFHTQAGHQAAQIGMSEGPDSAPVSHGAVLKPKYWHYNLHKAPDKKDILVHYCTSLQTSEKVAQYFKSDTAVGLDMEWIAGATMRDGATKNVSVIQLANKSRIAVFHIALFKPASTLQQLMPPTLRMVLESQSITKLGVAIKGDCTRLEKHLGVTANNLFELSHLYNKLKYPVGHAKHSSKRLANLALQVEEHLGLPLDKDLDVRCGNWTKRLNLKQVHYAAIDAYACIQLFDVMDAKRTKLENERQAIQKASSLLAPETPQGELPLPAEAEHLSLQSALSGQVVATEAAASADAKSLESETAASSINATG